MKAEQVRVEIEPIYIELFGAAGYEELNVHVGLDHADEPAVFINARIHGVLDASLESRVRELRERVFEKLRENEEGRFPYVRIAYDDQEEQEGTAGPDRLKRRAS